MDKSNVTYNFICFSNLAYEFNLEKSVQIESKITRRLKYYKLGPYSQEKVDYIRQLKNELYVEISKYDKSIYYKESYGKFAHQDDYDLELLKKDYLKKYTLIDESDMVAIINFAIYLYYLR